MAKKRGRSVYGRGTRQLYIGEWLVRLGRKPVELAKHLKVTEPYVSELISGKKDNPSHVLLLVVSEWLGITVNDLYMRPPDRLALEAVERLNPAQMATLGRLLDNMKRPGRK
jgi:transcriptional regulator with XRE-family HTH domain